MAAAGMNARAALQPPPRLAGDLFVWYIILLEGATFGVAFVAFAFIRLHHLALFNASQQQLDLSAGAINTALLLTASWCVAHAVHAVRASQRSAALLWLGAGMAGGAGFVALKLMEYADKAAQGIGLSTNLFFDFYFLLTGFHLLHVLAGLMALGLTGIGLMRQRGAALNAHTIETAAAFWHLVDLLWLVLFPLVYVMR
jgi:nitric oxide reductase NorE protein